MVRLTKAQRKDRERIDAWLEKKPFKENARDKDPQVPKLTIEKVLDTYVPEDISDGAKFYTPREMAEAFWTLASAGYVTIRPGMSVLEPCARIGNLLQPLYDTLEEWDWVVDAYELDKEACEIGAKLFHNRVIWHNESPFEDSVQLEGLYDLVIMNPPLRIKWANEIGSDWIESGATSSEYRFLELALRALKPGGQLMVIAPYNYIDRLPKGKGVKAWFDDFAEVEAEFGKLPGEFQFTKIQAFGFLIKRIKWSEEKGELPYVPDDYTPEEQPSMEQPSKEKPEDPLKEFETDLIGRIGEDLTAIKEKEGTEQLEILFLPPEPPTHTFQGERNIEELLKELEPVNYAKKPDAAFLRSVETWGVREPITLTRSTRTDSLRLRDGRRRLQAAIKLGLDSIPVKEYILENISGLALTLDSNTQRSSNPVAEYEAIAEFIDAAKEKGVVVTEQDISQATGMKVQTICKRMKLAQVPHEIRDAVGERKIALGVAESIASLQEYQKGELLDKFRINGKLTGNDVHQVKQVKQKIAIDNIPSEVFDLPEFDPEHQHQFKPRRVADMGFRCSCGRVLSQDEAINILNIYLD